MAKFERPSAGYTPTLSTQNTTQFQTDSAATPKVAISSQKMDGNINKLFDAVNEIWLLTGSGGNAGAVGSNLSDVVNQVSNNKDSISDLVAGGIGVTPSTNAVLMSKDGSTWTADKIGSENLKDSAVTEAKLAASAVTSGKISDGSVATAKIADAAVTTAKIADSGVTTAKIATGAVTGAKLEDVTTQAAFTVLSGTVDAKGRVISPAEATLPTGTETVSGIVELATTAEAEAGTADDKVLTPLKAKNQLDKLRHRHTIDMSKVTGTMRYNTLWMTDEDILFMAGDNASLQCGQGNDGDDTIFLSAVLLPRRTSAIKQVHLCYRTVYVLYEDGEVWAWGDDTYGRLGQGTNGTNWGLPRKITFPTTITKLVAIYGEGGYWEDDGGCMAYGSNGTVYLIGGNFPLGNGGTQATYTSPTAMSISPADADSVWGLCGNVGIIYYRESDHEMKALGYSFAGRAGNTASNTSSVWILTPTTMLGLPQSASDHVVDCKIVQHDEGAAGAQYLSVAGFKTNTKKLYVLGANHQDYNTGLARTSNDSGNFVCQAKVLFDGSDADSKVEDFGWVGVQSGGWALMESGKLFLYGYDRDGWIGRGTNDSTSYAPHEADSTLFRNKVSKVVTATQYFEPVLCVLTTEGNVIVSGYNSRGQLGMTEDAYANVNSFRTLQLPFKAKDIFWHGAFGEGGLGIVSEEGEVYMTGVNSNYMFGWGNWTPTVIGHRRAAFNV